MSLTGLFNVNFDIVFGQPLLLLVFILATLPLIVCGYVYGRVLLWAEVPSNEVDDDVALCFQLNEFLGTRRACYMKGTFKTVELACLAVFMLVIGFGVDRRLFASSISQLVVAIICILDELSATKGGISYAQYLALRQEIKRQGLPPPADTSKAVKTGCCRKSTAGGGSDGSQFKVSAWTLLTPSDLVVARESTKALQALDVTRMNVTDLEQLGRAPVSAHSADVSGAGVVLTPRSKSQSDVAPHQVQV